MSDNATTVIGNKKIDRAAMTRLYIERLNGKETLIIDGHKVNMMEALKVYKWNNSKVINEAMDTELQRFAMESYRMTGAELTGFAVDTMAHTTATMDRGFKGYFSAVQPNRSVAAEIVLKKNILDPWQTSQKHGYMDLKESWVKLAANERGRIEQTIRRGIAEKKTEDEIIRAVSKDFKMTYQHAETTVVTATTSVYAQADQQTYMANKKYLNGWQYVSILDSRTTPLCSHRDGTVYPVEDTVHLPPAHWRCRSSTIPVVKQWDSLGSLDSVQEARRVNTMGMTQRQIDAYDKEAMKYFDGNAMDAMSYNEWLLLQPESVQLRHLGDYERVRLLQNKELTVSRFTTNKGESVGLRDLRQMTGEEDIAGGFGGSVEGTSRVFVNAKERLDALRLPMVSPVDMTPANRKALLEYYKLQSGELNGALSTMNYRGILPHVKKSTKYKVLNTPPTDAQLLYNPMTKRMEDSRIYQPSLAANQRAIQLVNDSKLLSDADKQFILEFKTDIQKSVGMNEAAVVTDNLRIVYERFRKNGEPWGNLKAVLNSQLKFDLTNVSEYIETNLRNSSDFFYKMKQQAYLDPVLGAVQLEDLAKNLKRNIKARNSWEERVAIKIGKELKPFLNNVLPPKLWVRLSADDTEEFYTRFAMRLARDDAPDLDQVAIQLGRDLHELANYRGSKTEWRELGVSLLGHAEKSGFFELETLGVKKRRMRSRMSGQYFGQYYDTVSQNIKIKDARIKEYAKLNREIDVGFRIGVNPKFQNNLHVRPGFKTYFSDWNYDTRIPITSTHSYADFPAELVDDNLADALNWASQSKYKIDPDFHAFINKLLMFQDDKGQAAKYNALNQYKKYIAGRGDSYERFKAMEYYIDKDLEFSNHAFIDHRMRIYDAGLIGPQSGESFRPFLNTPEVKILGEHGFASFQDQVGSFLGGISDTFEGRFNGLTKTGKQKIAEHWRPDMVKIGRHMERGQPGDIRAVLESDIMQMIDGEEQGKFLRLALETYKIDKFMAGNYDDLSKLNRYKTALALEQDASSSGAQIIAMTTRNRQLAELSNVVPTHQKRRLYDEIAQSTFDDPRFKKLNEELGLSLKDLRKAAKAHNMVTLYGAGQRTAVMNVEKKLAKTLGKRDNILVVRASERDEVLGEISARAAKVSRWDPEHADELMQLRKQVKEVFDKGLHPGDHIMDELWFLQPGTKEFVTKLTRNYDEIVTPEDFNAIGKIMSEYMANQVPILTDFTKFFGRAAQDFLIHAKPPSVEFKRGVNWDWEKAIKEATFGTRDRQFDTYYNRLPGYNPKSGLVNAIRGYEKTKPKKNWTSVPGVNFDGNVLEQHYTQRFEERVAYKDADGNWVNNIVQIDQKTAPKWLDEIRNKSNKINDIADTTKARTSYGVNLNHSEHLL